jgi:hypothetical protein
MDSRLGPWLIYDGKLYKSGRYLNMPKKLMNIFMSEICWISFTSSVQSGLDHDLNIEYDASTFDTDPFEPQPDGVGTIFPSGPLQSSP